MNCSTKSREGLQPVGVPVKLALFLVAVFFALMVLFNGVAMCESAKRLEYGPTRDFWVAALQPIAWISQVSRLNLVRELPQATVGERLNRPNK